MSHEPNDLAPELKSLEAALAGLAPSGSAIDRDRLLYAAGSAAAQSVTRRRLLRVGLPVVAAIGLIPLLVFGSFWLREREQMLAERAVHAADMDAMVAKLNSRPAEIDKAIATVEHPPVLAADKNSYLRLRNVVLEGGVEALESPTGSASEMESPPESLRARDVWLQGI